MHGLQVSLYFPWESTENRKTTKNKAITVLFQVCYLVCYSPVFRASGVNFLFYFCLPSCQVLTPMTADSTLMHFTCAPPSPLLLSICTPVFLPFMFTLFQVVFSVFPAFFDSALFCLWTLDYHLFPLDLFGLAGHIFPPPPAFTTSEFTVCFNKYCTQPLACIVYILVQKHSLFFWIYIHIKIQIFQNCL